VAHVPQLHVSLPALQALCQLSAVGGAPPGVAAQALDALLGLLGSGAEQPGPTAVWARALGRPSLAALLDRQGTESPSSLPAMAETADEFFDAIFDGNLPSVVRHLGFSGGNALINAEGPRMHEGDHGCCRWSPVALRPTSLADALRARASLQFCLLLELALTSLQGPLWLDSADACSIRGRGGRRGMSPLSARTG